MPSTIALQTSTSGAQLTQASKMKNPESINLSFTVTNGAAPSAVAMWLIPSGKVFWVKKISIAVDTTYANPSYVIINDGTDTTTGVQLGHGSGTSQPSIYVFDYLFYKNSMYTPTGGRTANGMMYINVEGVLMGGG